jgi:hypothetical protein
VDWGLFIILSLVFSGAGHPRTVGFWRMACFISAANVLAITSNNAVNFGRGITCPMNVENQLTVLYTLMGYASLIHPTWCFWLFYQVVINNASLKQSCVKREIKKSEALCFSDLPIYINLRR